MCARSKAPRPTRAAAPSWTRARPLPGLRQAQKYAVRVGGGQNQRLALWHGILIKENHIAAAGGVPQVLRQALALNAGVEIQIEVETLISCARRWPARPACCSTTSPRMREAVATPAARCWKSRAASAGRCAIAATGVTASRSAADQGRAAIDFSMRVAVPPDAPAQLDSGVGRSAGRRRLQLHPNQHAHAAVATVIDAARQPGRAERADAGRRACVPEPPAAALHPPQATCLLPDRGERAGVDKPS